MYFLTFALQLVCYKFHSLKNQIELFDIPSDYHIMQKGMLILAIQIKMLDIYCNEANSYL